MCGIRKLIFRKSKSDQHCAELDFPQANTARRFAGIKFVFACLSFPLKGI